MSEDQTRPTAAPVTGGGVGPLVAALGIGLLRPLHVTPGPESPLGDPVIWDAESELPPAAHATLLMVGGRSSMSVARTALASAARRGYAAAVVKAYGEDPARWADCGADAGIAVLLAPDDTPWRHLDSLISAVVASEGAGASTPPTLSRVAIGDLFALANAVAAMVGGAITIEDVQRRLLAYSNLAGQPIDTSRRRTILGRQVPDQPPYADEYRRLAHGREPLRFPAYPEHGDTLPRLAVPVWAGSRVLGSIWAINADDGLDLDRAEHALRSAARIAALHLLHAGLTADLRRRRRGEWLAELLTSPARAGDLPLGIETPAVLVGFAERSRPGDIADSARVADLVAVYCETHQSQAATAAVGGTVYALLPLAGTPRDRLRFLAGQIIGSAGASLGIDLVAAVGGPVASVPELPASHGEIDRALRWLLRNAAEEAADRGPVLDIEAGRQVLVLEELAEAARAGRTRPLPVLTRILAYDREHGTSYLATLRAHLDSGGDAAAASRRLLIHINTFRYRLRRLSELFGLDLADPELRLVAWLQLRTLTPFQSSDEEVRRCPR